MTLTGILLFTAIPVSAAPASVAFTGGTIEYMVADEPVVISVSENNIIEETVNDDIAAEGSGPIGNCEITPYSLYDYVSFTRSQSRGKAVLDYGEWKFDQTFARGELFNAFQQARGTESNYRLRDNDGNWYYVDKDGFEISDPSERDGLATPYVWDCNLEAVAMQRAIEQVDTDSHYRPDGTSQSTAYREYSASPMEHEDILWLEFAKTDLGVAKHLNSQYHPKTLEIICYHFQLSAEKAIKG